MSSSRLLSLSPLPVIDLHAIEVPADGMFVNTPAVCRRKFPEGLCSAHYRRIAEDPSL